MTPTPFPRDVVQEPLNQHLSSLLLLGSQSNPVQLGVKRQAFLQAGIVDAGFDRPPNANVSRVDVHRRESSITERKSIMMIYIDCISPTLLSCT